MSAARDLFKAVFETPEGCSQAEFRRLMDAYKAEVLREAATAVRNWNRNWSDDVAAVAVDETADLIDPDKK